MAIYCYSPSHRNIVLKRGFALLRTLISALIQPVTTNFQPGNPLPPVPFKYPIPRSTTKSYVAPLFGPNFELPFSLSSPLLYINALSPNFPSIHHSSFIIPKGFNTLPNSLPAHPISLKLRNLSYSRSSKTLKNSTNLRMGICTSCESTHVSTAKLILQDGRLQEFPYPVKASYVLQKNPMCFICNSDEMDFDDAVSAIHEDEELLPGQLYFALPLSWLKHPLQAEEMAALAVKASSALMKSGTTDKCSCRRSKTVTPLMFSAESPRRKVASSASTGGGGKGCEKKSRGGKGRRKFEAMLSAIPE